MGIFNAKENWIFYTHWHLVIAMQNTVDTVDICVTIKKWTYVLLLCQKRIKFYLHFILTTSYKPVLNFPFTNPSLLCAKSLLLLSGPKKICFRTALLTKGKYIKLWSKMNITGTIK